MFNYPLNIPRLNTETETWDYVTIENKTQFIEFVESNVKLPGKYKLKKTNRWQDLVKEYYKNNEEYCLLIPETIQEVRFWEKEREKVLCGVIIDETYLPPFYYWYLNFCPIYDKVKRKQDFASPWDSDLHFFYYILLCILKGRHAIVVKCRQRGYTFKIMAILLWSYWWFKGSINTLGASDEEFTLKSWEYMAFYRNHINVKTPWIRGPQIPKKLEWIERSMTEEGTFVGNNSKLSGLTFKQSPSKGVGGPQTIFFYEEAGIAPTLLSTIGYIRPAIEQGNEVTGLIIVSGSVGELEQCKDLEKIFRSPEKYKFLPVVNTFDPESSLKECGFFVPHTWNLQGFIDDEGNSLIEEAFEFAMKERKASEGISFEDAQLAISQNPVTFEEAFGVRTKSFFKSSQIKAHQERMLRGKSLTIPVILDEINGEIKWRRADRPGDPHPIKEWPLPEGTKDVRGCIEIKEFPVLDENNKKPKFLNYYAGVDPIQVDKTTTSESLFSIYIFKSLTEIKYLDEEGNIKTKVSGFEPVAWYVGRYDDLKETNTVAEVLIKYYNAFTICESNVQSFINHMQERKLQNLLATKKEIGFLEDLKANTNVHKQYGVHMTATIKDYIFQNIKDYFEEEIDVIYKNKDEVLRRVYGIERILDSGLLDEARKFTRDNNTDRLISFGLALSLAKYHYINNFFTRIDKTKEQAEKNMIPVLPPRGYFKHLGFGTDVPLPKKSYFKGLNYE